MGHIIELLGHFVPEVTQLKYATRGVWALIVHVVCCRDDVYFIMSVSFDTVDDNTQLQQLKTSYRLTVRCSSTIIMH